MSQNHLVKLRDHRFQRKEPSAPENLKDLPGKKPVRSEKKIQMASQGKDLKDTFNPIPQLEHFLIKLLSQKNGPACLPAKTHDFQKGDKVYIPVHWKGKQIFAEGKVLAVLSDGRRKVILEAMSSKPFFLKPEILKHPEDLCVLHQRGITSLWGRKEIDQNPPFDEAESSPEMTDQEKQDNEGLKGKVEIK